MAALFLAAPGMASGEPDYVIRNWDALDGAPMGPITAITQDADGYLWLGTYFGLARFDGIQFTQWPTEPKCHQGPLVSRDGSLWLAFERGVAHVQGKRAAMHLAGLSLSVTYTGRRLMDDDSGDLWAATGKGLWRYRTGTWKRIRIRDRPLELPINTLFVDHRDDLWVGGVSGIFRRRAGTAIFDWVRATSSFAPRSAVLARTLTVPCGLLTLNESVSSIELVSLPLLSTTWLATSLQCRAIAMVVCGLAQALRTGTFRPCGPPEGEGVHPSPSETLRSA